MLLRRLVLLIGAVVLAVHFFIRFCVAGESEKAIKLADDITGLNRLADVRVDAESFTLPADDDTPLRLFKEHLLKGSLWKVSYKVDALQHENKVNPHIVGFDVYVDVSIDKVLKIVSRDAEGLPEEFRKGIEVSNREVRSIFKENPRYIKDALPTVKPTFKLANLLAGKGIICRHYEFYYILGGDPNNDKAVPMWLVIIYGAAPSIEPSGGGATEDSEKPRKRPKVRKLADGYFRTLAIHYVDAMSGEWLGFAYIMGENTDTFE